MPFAGMLNTPGAVAARGTITVFDFTVPTVTIIVADDPVTPKGTSALICVDVTE